MLIFFLGIIPTSLDILLHETQSLIVVKSVCMISYVFFISYCIISFYDKILKKKWFKFFLVSIWILVFIIESFLLATYDTLISPSIIFILANTNLSEVLEFLSFIFTPSNIIRSVIILATPVIIVWGEKFLKILPFMQFKCFGWGVLFMLVFGGCVFGYSFHRLPSIISYRVITPCERLFFSIQQAKQDLNEMKNALADSRFSEPSLLKNESEIKNIVILLGESLSKDKMGCYGYYLNTTPLLEQKIKNGNLHLFKDVIAPYGVTSECIKNIMTSYNTESTSNWLDSEVLADAMEKAGYTSYWISNQENFGVFANLPVMISKRFDVVNFTRIRSSSEERYGTFDEDLLPLVKNVLEDSANKRFIVIHMMGSHTRYKYRYPTTFDLFSSNDIKGKTKAQAKVISEYLNSVLYTDYVVNNILDLFKEDETLVFFFSDHGEEVYDFRNFAGHGITKNSRYIAEIPFMVYYSDTIAKKYPNKVNKIKSSVDFRFMTDDFYSTLLDIVGIETEHSDSTKSLFNSCFNQERKRIFNGNIDYDKILKNKN